VLKGIPKRALVDISLRSSRVDGDLDDDVPAKAGDTVQGYVVETNKKGCFVRLAHNVEGRVTRGSEIFPTKKRAIAPKND
jgi:ribosomal protein S1